METRRIVFDRSPDLHSACRLSELLETPLRGPFPAAARPGAVQRWSAPGRVGSGQLPQDSSAAGALQTEFAQQCVTQPTASVPLLYGGRYNSSQLAACNFAF